ncbi:hypothetical protein BXZ70DRAFT_207837 [Cristinia sonorae]|uniref:Uncharacterized protein n=1 Tax=Cristinia sonorae TaxID=1940300 RepID=A0A8K0UMU0_9AGAR|nr:hypothetical protein BXZ70DRAFT_207837 [Cristinia sonorae]
MEQTQPGLPRAYYMGHARSEAIVHEAQRGVQDVVFSIEPGTGRRAGGGSSQSFQPQPPQNAPGGYSDPGQSYSSPQQQDRPLSGQFSPDQVPPAPVSVAGYMSPGDRPGETLMRADSIGHGSIVHSHASVPPTPQSYGPPSGLPPGQGYAQSNMSGQSHAPGQLQNYPTRASFIGLPQIPQQQSTSDFGMTSYLSPSSHEGALPPVPEHQHQQQDAPPPPPPPQQSPYQQPQSPYQQPPQQQYSQQQPPQATPYPEPQMYPPTQQNLPPQSMPQSPNNYANYTYPQAQPPAGPPQGGVNEFGTYTAPSGRFPPRTSSFTHTRPGVDGPTSPDASSGRFSTFPVKATGPRPPPGTGASGGTVPGNTRTSGTSSILSAPVLEQKAPSLDVEREEDSFASSVTEALNQSWQHDRSSQVLQNNATPAPAAPISPAPSAPTSDSKHSYHLAEQSHSATTGHGPINDGVTPPPYEDTDPNSLSANRISQHQRTASDVEDDIALAYMSDPDEADAGGGGGSEGSQGDGKVVRWGSVRDVDEEMMKRKSQPNNGQQDELHRPDPSHSDIAQPAPVAPSFNQMNSFTPAEVTPHRAPTPSEEGHGDEAALNRAAAREVSRELDQLMFNSQSSPVPPPAPASPPASAPPAQTNSPQQTSPISPSPPYQMYRGGGMRSQSPPHTSPLSPREPQYIREKDRASRENISRRSSPAPVPESQSSPLPPPTINTSSSGGVTTPFRTPPEYPSPSPGGSSFYSLGQTATGSSSSFIPGATPRTISAAAFKRQVRQPTLPPDNGSVDLGSGGPGGSLDVSPLHVRKRVPGSPQPLLAEGHRVPSAPVSPAGGYYQNQNMGPGPGAQYRSVSSSGYAQQLQQPPQQNDYYRQGQQQGYPQHQENQNDEESYDYLSAYMNTDARDGSLR